MAFLVFGLVVIAALTGGLNNFIIAGSIIGMGFSWLYEKGLAPRWAGIGMNCGSILLCWGLLSWFLTLFTGR